MRNKLAFLIGGGLLLWMISNQAAAAPVEFAGEADESTIDATDATDAIPESGVLSNNSFFGGIMPGFDNQPVDVNSQISAFLAVIRKFESHGDYQIIYGGGHFSDFSSHPQVRVPINLPGYEGKFSTAAGAYQINFPTYKDFAAVLGISDFSPESQDRIAIAILNKCGAIDALARGNVEAAFVAASKRWASLPGSTANQHPQLMQTAIDSFVAAGGNYA